MKQLTFQNILDMNPCSKHTPSKYIPKTWTGTILDILRLKNVAPTEKLWVAYKVLDDKTLRLFAVACARRALSRVEKPDVRSLIAVNMAEAYAHGRATKGELALAFAAAYAVGDTAYADAAAVYAAARAAATAAAYAAADVAAADAAAIAAHAAGANSLERNQQIADLIKLVEEGV
jgi:hypothetical protein